MYVKSLSIAAAAAAMLASAGLAEAAEKCSTKGVAGVHILRTTAPSVCLLELNSKGTITESRCWDPTFETSLGVLQGTLSVTSSCRMTGEVTQVFEEPRRRVEFTLQAKGALVDGLLELLGTARSVSGKLKIETAQQW